jgi:hypothetical protein
MLCPELILAEKERMIPACMHRFLGRAQNRRCHVEK